MKIPAKYVSACLLMVMTCVAACFRYYRLDHQSLWYDELYTMNESNPAISWKQFFYYMQTDQHPPLYFILQRWAFSLFGYTEWTARALSALFGSLCVPAMYFLGKELQGRKLGLVAAALIVANQYSIRYSHDARPYVMVWLLAILSYLYLIRTIKTRQNSDAALYTLFSVALIYTNYFAILAIFSQAVIVLVMGMNRKADRVGFFGLFGICAAVIAISYIPWYQYLFAQMGLKPYWLKPEPSGFLLYYYYAFFGGERFLAPFLLVAPVAYIYYLYRQKVFKATAGSDNDKLGFVFIVCSVAIPLAVMYAYSVLRTPVMQMRYVVVVLPGIFLMVAWGIASLRSRIAVGVSAAIFMVVAAYNVTYRHHFFSYPTEMQYRQATAYMAEGNKSYPVLNRMNGWHMRYYMNREQYRGKLYKGKKELVIDSVLNGLPGYELDTFWVVTGFLDKPLSQQIQERMEPTYTRVKAGEFKTVTVELYGRRK